MLHRSAILKALLMEDPMSDGLDDVVAAETILSDVDGAAGRLIIRGHLLDDLAGRTSFAEAAELLLDGFFDDLPRGAALLRRSARAGSMSFARSRVSMLNWCGEPLSRRCAR